jgi:hypothetical protein
MRVVDNALDTARQLRSLAIDALEMLEGFRTAGPVRAVAELVAIDEISTPLAEAERALGDGDIERAANQASLALDAALSRVTPALRSWRHSESRFRFRIHDIRRESGRDLGEMLESLEDRANRLEAWALAIGLGLRPAELARLQRLLGRPLRTLGPQTPDIMRREDVELTANAVEWAVLLTADVIYRLWQDESMRLGETGED